MHFGTAEDQASLRNAVREFAAAELAPGYLALTKSERSPWELHRKVAGSEFVPYQRSR